MINIPIEVAEALKKATTHKNIRISFPFDYYNDITNEQIESESMNFTESFCSRSEIKFGLCEASKFSVNVYDIENIKGKMIDVSIEVDVDTKINVIHVNNKIELTVEDGTAKGFEAFFRSKGKGGYTAEYADESGEVFPTFATWNAPYEKDFSVSIPYLDNFGRHLIPQTIEVSGVVSDADVHIVYEKPYAINLGRFVVDSCKRDSSNANKRQIEAYSEAAYLDWSVPESLKALSKYTFSSTETLNFSGQDIIDLISPSTHYERNEYRKLTSGNTDIVSYRLSDNTYDIQVIVYGITMGPLTNDSKRTIFGYRTHIDAGELFNGLAWVRRTLMSKGISQNLFPYNPKDIIDKCNGSLYVGSYANINTAVADHRENAFKVSMPADNMPHTIFSIVNTLYSSGSTIIGGTYKGYFKNGTNQYDLGDYWQDVKVPKRINVIIRKKDTSIVLNENYTFSDDDFYLEYLETQIGQSDAIITMQSKSFSNNNLFKLTNGQLVRQTRTDYGFKNDFEKWFSDDDMREIVESYCELQGGFGKFERNGSFVLDYLVKFDSLRPRVGLHPSHGLHPRKSNIDSKLYKSSYSSCWYDDNYTKLYSKIVANYKDASNNDAYYEYVIVDLSATDDDGVLLYDANDYQEYDISENYFIKNRTYTEEQLRTLLQTVANRINGIQYMPFDAEIVGVPQMEAGDSITIQTSSGTFDSYVLRRALKGIQNLMDSITSD